MRTLVGRFFNEASSTLFNLWIFALLIAVYSVSSSQAQTINDSNLSVRQIASLGVGAVGGTQIYTNMAFIGPNDILVLGKDNGVITRITNGVENGEVLNLNVTSAGFGDERGLLGIAVHSNFASNGFVYLYYTKSATAGDNVATPLDNRVERYTWNGSALGSPLLIRSLPFNTADFHVGGSMTFGPDGKLYFVIGDLDRNGRLQNNSAGAVPDDTGVIFRLNDDGSTPTDNPFFAQGGNLARYYAYGIRNSFGITFDSVTNKLWMTENGEDFYDEINLVAPGFNSGWNKISGPDSRDPQGVGDLFSVTGSQYADPKFSWFSTVAPTALAFVNSGQLGTSYHGNLFVGDFNNGNLYRFKLNAQRDGFVFQGAGLTDDLVADNNTELTETILGNFNGGIADLKVGPDGKLYVLTIFGVIYVIERNLVVNCASRLLQPVIDEAQPGDVITVMGSCKENVVIRNEKQRITLMGSGACICPTDGTRPAVVVRGKGILIKNLSVSGLSGSLTVGIHVNRGSNAVIDSSFVAGNVIGVLVDELSFATITNSSITNNTGAQILVSENSTARIGFNLDSDTDASPNSFSTGGTGIIISNGSSARIIGNEFQSLSTDGIVVERDSHADIASNTINFMGNDAIVVRENSSAQLGEDSGSDIFSAENTGDSDGFAVRCESGSAVDGILGALSGSAGTTSIAANCLNSLL